MWRQKTKAAERPVEADSAVDGPEAVDGHILRMLEAAGAGQSLHHARRLTDDLAVMLIGSGTSTFSEFDLSLERLKAQGLIELDKDGFVCLSERGRDLTTEPALAFSHTDSHRLPGPAVA
jgi:ribosomal protein S19E (S16A)